MSRQYQRKKRRQRLSPPAANPYGQNQGSVFASPAQQRFYLDSALDPLYSGAAPAGMSDPAPALLRAMRELYHRREGAAPVTHGHDEDTAQRQRDIDAALEERGL